MLTTSPVLAGSASASSPTAFRRGHAPSSPKARRASLVAASSSTALGRSPLHNRADGSYAPVTDGTSAPNAGEQQQGAAAPLGHQNRPPAAPRSQFFGNATHSAPSSAQDAPAGTTVDLAQQVLSPNKRRGSPSHTMPQALTGPSTQPIGQDLPASNTSKRPRTDQQPPKILPTRYELCAVEDMVELIAHMLAELIATNDAIRISSGGLTRFHSRTAPGISVRDYLHRLAKHATLTPPLLLAMVYYIDRLCALYQEFTINTLTVHRFLITAATVAAKGLSDSFWNNTTYARVGGVRVAELKLLELEFLYRVDWKIVPNPEVLVAYYRGLVERTPGYELETDGSSDGDLDDDDVDGE
ncbi:Pho80p cyclin [Purpureocillium takamizusanense]|uniref:Pho80p cyclin n=1 Tax=Purpureocillium takamizusanense TaxID=2060973 RepID=A0A9Q8QIB7_9HYPO|nr:Pho80p cyclin [Purpureocillium takamizusanense]UNI20323.1 Pho80p cyclin [Purpureocillium takamizusanense]